MKKGTLLLFMLLGFLLLETQAQEVAKRIVVEQYTNTRCGICANRNPGFFANLENHQDVFHIAIYPSAPYPTCVLHQHNPIESDARTQAYEIYGGTPRLVIQGTPISAGENYASPSIFELHEGQTTPISLNVIQTKTDDELIITLVVKAEADNTIGSATLFIAAVEQLIEYDAPNGETEHPNVFRKTLNNDPIGEVLSIPAIAGDSLLLSYSMMADVEWDFSRIYAMAILQDANDRSVIQVDASDPDDNVMVVDAKEVNTIEASVFPNPVQNKLQIRLADDETAHLALYDSQGKRVQKRTFIRESVLELNALPNGIYWLHIETENGVAVRKVVKG